LFVLFFILFYFKDVFFGKMGTFSKIMTV